MDNWILAISFIVIGILLILFTKRLASWSQRLGVSITLRIVPELRQSGKSVDEIIDAWNKSWGRFYDMAVIWCIRLLSFIIIVFGALAIYVLLTQ